MMSSQAQRQEIESKDHLESPLKEIFFRLSVNTDVTSQSRTLNEYLYTVGLVLLTKESKYLILHCLQPRLGYSIYQQYFTDLCNYCSNTLLF